MPFLILLGFGALIGGLLASGSYLLSGRPRTPKAEVGSDVVLLGVRGKAPLAYKGEALFSIPQERWGRVECVMRAGQGYCYGLRFRNGNAVVLRDYEVTR